MNTVDGNPMSYVPIIHMHSTFDIRLHYIAHHNQTSMCSLDDSLQPDWNGMEAKLRLRQNRAHDDDNEKRWYVQYMSYC